MGYGKEQTEGIIASALKIRKKRRNPAKGEATIVGASEAKMSEGGDTK